MRSRNYLTPLTCFPWGGVFTESVDNALNGNTALVLSSVGTRLSLVTLDHRNSYTGTTTINGGTLTVSGAGAISASAITLNGGLLLETANNALNGTTALTVTTGTATSGGSNNCTGPTNVTLGILTAAR